MVSTVENLPVIIPNVIDNWNTFLTNALARYPTKSKTPPDIIHTRLPCRLAMLPVIGAVVE